MHAHDPLLRWTAFPTPFGAVRLAWAERARGPQVIRIVLPGDTRGNRGEFSPVVFGNPVGNKKIRALINDIRSFLSGKNVVFSTEILELDRCRPFQRRVLLAEHAIPRGYVSTYGRIARHLCVPGGARAVGNALAKNPFPVVIPCHRALRSDGSPGGFQGGAAMKVRLLEMEGASFLPDGKVRMERFWY